MPSKQKQVDVPATPRTHGVEPRYMQTSGIFRLPAELIVEILSHYLDPHHNILHKLSGRATHGTVTPEHVERLTVIRKLTMTCWHLRNALFPLLWRYVEGCNLFRSRPVYNNHPWPDPVAPLKNGLYSQCTYLVLNPAIGTYVQALSVELCFTDAPKDLMTKFVDCLVRLPNLRTLEIFSATHIGPITRGLKRKCARFTRIRELTIVDTLVKFVGSFPNVESITVIGFSRAGVRIFTSRGKELKKLKRVAGVGRDDVQQVVQCYPDLQEICIRSVIGGYSNDTQVVEHLRSLKCLAVVGIEFLSFLFDLDEIPGTAKYERRRAKTTMDFRAWKRHLTEVLRDSPSAERKFLRWKVYEKQRRGNSVDYILVAEGEQEVLPETSL